MLKFPSPKALYKVLYNKIMLKAHKGNIGVGLIGVGGWGATNATSIMRSKKFDVCAVYDKHFQLSHKFSQRFHTKCFEQLDDLFACLEIQAVVITVPNQFHAELVRAAADAGKHIFIEKPLASSPAICRELGAYCKKKDVILQVGHQVRFEPVFIQLKRIVDNCELGHPLYVQAVHTLERRSRIDWRQNCKSCPGGSMEQLGVHLIDLLIHIFGIPNKSEGWSLNIPCKTSAPDWGQVKMSFNFDSDVCATVSTSFSCPNYMRLEFFFDQGYLCTDGKSILVQKTGFRSKKISYKGLSGGIAQFVKFAECIESESSPEVGAEEAAVVMDVVNTI